MKERAVREGGKGTGMEEREQGGGRVAVALRDDEGALGAGWFPGSMCVPPPSLHSATPLPPPNHPPPLAAPGGSYTNFQECLLPPSVPLNLLPLFTPRSPLRPLFPSPGTSRTSSRVSMATWRRVFAYYTLCVTSRLVRYARVGVGYPPLRERAREYVYECVYVCVGARLEGVAKESAGGVSGGR